MHIEIISNCNERCIHCYIPHDYKVSYIEPDLFYDVLKQCKNMRLLHLTLSGGEPLLHKNICDLLKKCREYDFSVNVLKLIKQKMYITDITHFLDESGNIPKKMPKEARQLASFYTFVIEAVTSNFPSILNDTEIRCFEYGCQGMISTELKDLEDEIFWECSECPNEGRISHWQGTQWNNK